MANIAYWDGGEWRVIATGNGGGGSGLPGPKGDKGDKGEDGKSISVSKQPSQPATAEIGDVWIQEQP
jgi:hypothetical protein